ncbi:MAG: hypothetical protein ACODAQ_08100 [Phycisphaeraceae bacterium]
MRPRFISAQRKHRIAEHMAMVVMAIQLSVVLALALVPGEPPRMQIGFLEGLWASARRPTFYPFVALLTAGPVLTVLALRWPGRHRAWLALAWCAFALVGMIVFGRRVAVMVDVVWWQLFP